MWQSIINTALTMLVGLIVTAIFNGAINIPKKKKAAEEKRYAELKDEMVSLKKDIDLLKKASQVQLKNGLKVRYDYWIDEGYAPNGARDDLEAEYRIYHSLGKNGVMDNRRANFLALPKNPPEEMEV